MATAAYRRVLRSCCNTVAQRVRCVRSVQLRALASS
jgi:hypothetical protein